MLLSHFRRKYVGDFPLKSSSRNGICWLGRPVCWVHWRASALCHRLTFLFLLTHTQERCNNLSSWCEGTNWRASFSIFLLIWPKCSSLIVSWCVHIDISFQVVGLCCPYKHKYQKWCVCTVHWVTPGCVIACIHLADFLGVLPLQILFCWHNIALIIREWWIPLFEIRKLRFGMSWSLENSVAGWDSNQGWLCGAKLMKGKG